MVWAGSPGCVTAGGLSQGMLWYLRLFLDLTIGCPSNRVNSKAVELLRCGHGLTGGAVHLPLADHVCA